MWARNPGEPSRRAPRRGREALECPHVTEPLLGQAGGQIERAMRGLPELPQEQGQRPRDRLDRPERRGRRRCSSSHCGDPRSSGAAKRGFPGTMLSDGRFLGRLLDRRGAQDPTRGAAPDRLVGHQGAPGRRTRRRRRGRLRPRSCRSLGDTPAASAPRSAPRPRTLVAATRPGCTRTQARARRAPLTHGVGPLPRGVVARARRCATSRRAAGAGPRWPRRPARRRRRPAARRGERP